jgi:ribosomal protein L11 methylase PrmA
MSWRLLALRALGSYLRHAPAHRGRWRLIAPAVALAPALKATRRSAVIRVREGFRFRVDGTSQTGRILYATGEYEAPTTRVIKRLLKPGDTVIDVGANIGYFSVVGAR